MQVAVIARAPSARIGLRVMLEGRSCLTVIADVATAEEVELLSTPPDALVFDYEDEAVEPVLDICVAESIGLVVLGGDTELAGRLAQTPLRGWAVLARDASPDELAAGVQGAAAGLVVLGGYAAMAIRQASPIQTFESDETLTARENDVLQAMAGGLANKQIALRLGISVHTVKFHVAAILAKLDVSSRTEAVAAGLRRGLVRL